MINHIIKPFLLDDTKNTIKMNVDHIKNWENGANIVQAIFDMWVSKGYRIDDIEDNFTNYYVKKSKQGESIEVIDGETSKDKLIAELLEKIAEVETENRAYKIITRKLYKKIFENEAGYDKYIKENRR